MNIGSRHLLPAAGLADAMAGARHSVRIVVSPVWANSTAGQLLASCLVNLLCRQVGIVDRIEISSPRTAALVRMPDGTRHEYFPECLEHVSAWAVNNQIAVCTKATDNRFTHTITIGQCAVAPPSDYSLVAMGSGWRAWVGDPNSATPDVEPNSTNSIGPFLAAALVAGEVFKRNRGIRRGKYLRSAGYSLWSGESSDSWGTLTDGPPLTEVRLPPTHIVGVGAVGNDLVYTLANADLASSYLILIDDDRYDDTNLNRCLLAGWKQKGDYKAESVFAYLQALGGDGYHFKGKIAAYTQEPHAALHFEERRRIADLDYQIVLSCVDKGSARQDVQGLRPKMLLGGSTLNLQAKAQFYGGRNGFACLACYNPAERDLEKFEVLKHQLQRMDGAKRREFLLKAGLEPVAIEQYLANPDCGSIGEDALRDYAIKPPNEFSAGFVSLGASLLLAASLLRRVAFREALWTRKDNATLNFLNGGFLEENLSNDPSCQRCCGG